MKEQEYWDYIEEAGKRGSVYGLESIRGLLDKLSHPERKVKLIHVAGTNGKGSTVSMLSMVLRRAGYKTGTYTSPAVFDYKERINVNGRNISMKSLCEGMEIIKEKCEELEAEGKALPTLFEMETCLAFWYFAQCECDYAVVECGLGGQDDATNIIESPVLTVFARISMDHMSFLGDSIGKIAQAKAGIIKKGAVAVSCMQEEAARTALSEKANSESVKIFFADEVSSVKRLSKNGGLQRFNYKGYKDIEITLNGNYQIYNAATVIECVMALRTIGANISDKALYDGLRSASICGRFETISKKPLFIIDGAHNDEAALRLKETMDIYLKDRPLILICGVLRDKDYDLVMQHTVKGAAQVITLTPPDNPRALGALELAETVTKYNPNVTTADSVEEAAEIAMLLAGRVKDSAIVAFGSLSFLGRLKKAVNIGLVYNNV